MILYYQNVIHYSVYRDISIESDVLPVQFSLLIFRSKLQLQAFAARDIVRGFLGHSYQLRFCKLGNTNCYFKIFCCKCVLLFERLLLAF